MHIDKAIRILEDAKAEGVKNIIFNFWEANAFVQTKKKALNEFSYYEHEDNDEWADLAETIEDNIDWSDLVDDMQRIIDEEEDESWD